jgi:signal transduction histidine kinase
MRRHCPQSSTGISDMGSGSPSTDVPVIGAARQRVVSATWLKGIVLLLSGGLAVATVMLVGLDWSRDPSTFFGGSPLNDTSLVLSFALYPALGVLILRHRPGNRIGWVFLGAGVFWLAQIFAHDYAMFGNTAMPGSLPGAMLVAWLSLWIGVPGMAMAFVFLPLQFPDGRLPTRWHRMVAWFSGFALAFMMLTWATDTEMGYLAVPNPTGVEIVGRLGLSGLSWGLMVISILGTVTAVVIRYRRARGTEKRQMQWLAYAAALVGLTLVTVTIGSEWEPAVAVAEVSFPLAIASIPVAAFVAIFKHDLYDLGAVVSKTITFGILAALIATVYALLVVGVGSMVGGDSDVVLAVAATALVAVAFQPVRLWVQQLAKRFVYGERADPYDVLAELAHRMSQAPSQDTVLEEMARLVAHGTGARRTDLWLVVGHQLRRVSSWPSSRDPSFLRFDGESLPEFPDTSHTVEIRKPDVLLGALALTLPPGQDLTPTEKRLVADLAAQAGLVFDNLRLVEELRASRQRIVTAQDTERRRLERDIHDGVQQGLLTLALTLRTEAATLENRGEGEASQRLHAAADEAREVLHEVRHIARGIHPAIVTEGGLAAALESLADRTPVPTLVRASNLDDLELHVEVTVYYVAAEGLANATKHASAARIDVSAERSDGTVRVDIVDDGVGGADTSGHGLTGLSDRIAALGGTLNVESVPGEGTRLRAVIPCGSS